MRDDDVLHRPCPCPWGACTPQGGEVPACHSPCHRVQSISRIHRLVIMVNLIVIMMKGVATTDNITVVFPAIYCVCVCVCVCVCLCVSVCVCVCISIHNRQCIIPQTPHVTCVVTVTCVIVIKTNISTTPK